ncbi:hypothetical protein GBAR_LOCUS17850, partial [Geodia barretti]
MNRIMETDRSLLVITMVSALRSVQEPLIKPSVGDGIESRRPCSALHFLSILFYVVCLFYTFTGVC